MSDVAPVFLTFASTHPGQDTTVDYHLETSERFPELPGAQVEELHYPPADDTVIPDQNGRCFLQAPGVRAKT